MILARRLVPGASQERDVLCALCPVLSLARELCALCSVLSRCLFLSCPPPPRRLDAVHRAAAARGECELRGTRVAACCRFGSEGVINRHGQRAGSTSTSTSKDATMLVLAGFGGSAAGHGAPGVPALTPLLWHQHQHQQGRALEALKRGSCAAPVVGRG